MKGISIEFKVGFFIIIAIAVLSMMVFQIGGLNIFNANMYKLSVIFDFVNGIAKDAPVHVAGVNVGKVEGVEIFYNLQQQQTQVRLRMMLQNTVKIPKDSVAYINSLGILGEKYVEIVPGKERDNFLSEGDFLIGNNPVQLEKLTESLVDIVGDQTVRDSLRESFYNVRIATENLREASEGLNEAVTEVKKGKGTIGKLIKDDSLYTQTEMMVANLNQKLDKTITDLNASLNDLINDLKTHPWKLFQRPAKKKTPTKTKDSGDTKSNRGYLIHK
ncbi:MAG: MCE family protein [Candidatus Omnitrophica bacterium]|nr:MCE family protein [Candidatus Omnitrophota bacterium]MBU4479145.1 MCE family protein [Candidatus Omnitrophota bacterium]MCG2702784.1 MlaD family protein [Candidatus Omnitrophota bacterium]